MRWWSSGLKARPPRERQPTEAIKELYDSGEFSGKSPRNFACFTIPPG